MNCNTNNTTDHGFIHSIESLATLDGPGLRTVVFLQGCLMRCKYCHNIDTTPLDGGTKYTVEELTTKILKNKPYWGSKDSKEIKGGITFSGGEPTLQTEFIVAVMRKLQEEKVHIALDTNMFSRKSKIKELVPYVNYWMISIKELNSTKHKELTGVGNKKIRENVQYLDEQLSQNNPINATIRIRYVLIPGMTDTDEYLTKFIEYIQTIKNLDVVEILPYSALGRFKWIELFGKYEFNEYREAEKRDVDRVEKVLGKYFRVKR